MQVDTIILPKHQAFIDMYFFECQKNPTKAYQMVYPTAKPNTCSKMGRELLLKLQKTPYFGQVDSEYRDCIKITLKDQLEKLMSLYDDAMAINDIRVALEAVKEQNKLLGLYR